MAEVLEETPVDQAAVDAAFREGYADAPTETPAATPPVVETPVETPPEPAIEYAQLTKDQLADLLKIKDLQGKLDEGFGTLGHVHQAIKALQSATPSGQSLEVTDEDMAELVAEFPEFGQLTRKALTKVFSRFKGTAAPVDFDAIVAQVQERATKARQAECVEDVLEDHPDFWSVVGKYETRATAPNAFQSWVAKQPPEFQHRIWNTNSAAFLTKQVTRFKTETATPEPPPKAPNERTAHLKAAVTPRGVAPGGASPEENGFNSGFKDEAKKLGLS